MEHECHGCKRRFFSQGSGTGTVACAHCGLEQPERDQPSGAVSDGRLRNMVDPATGKDMGGDPMTEGILGGSQPLYRRDESFASVAKRVKDVDRECPGCHGAGKIHPNDNTDGPYPSHGQGWEECPTCHGNGELDPLKQSHGGHLDQTIYMPWTTKEADLLGDIGNAAGGIAKGIGHGAEAVGNYAVNHPVDTALAVGSLVPGVGLAGLAGKAAFMGGKALMAGKVMNGAMAAEKGIAAAAPAGASAAAKVGEAAAATAKQPGMASKAMSGVGRSMVYHNVAKGLTGGGQPAPPAGGQMMGQPAQAPSLQAVTHITADIETPTSLPALHENDGDTHQFKDQVDDHANPDHPNSDESGVGSDSPAGALMEHLWPLAMAHYLHDESGADDPLMKALDHTIEHEHPRYKDADDGDHSDVEHFIKKYMTDNHKTSAQPFAPGMGMQPGMAQQPSPGNAVVPDRPAPPNGPQPQQNSCPTCGAQLSPDGTCPQCGFGRQNPAGAANLNQAVTPGTSPGGPGLVQSKVAGDSQWYHVAPKEHREAITREGLKPSWGGGFGTGQSPLAGSTKLNGVYLTKDPNNVGIANTRHTYNSDTHDLWQTNVDKSQLHPDYPAVVEHGAYVEPDHMWFDEDNPLHDHFGDKIPFDDTHPGFIDMTGTARHDGPIHPSQLKLTPSVQSKVADTQGPYTPEQYKAVAQYLLEAGRQSEIPHMYDAPWEYADVLAKVQNKQNAAPPAVPVPAQPPAPAGGMDPSMMDPSAAPPGGAPDPSMMQSKVASALARLAADNIAPKCPKCQSHTTGINATDDEVNCRCHNCGKVWKEKDLQKIADSEHFHTPQAPLEDHELQHDGDGHSDSTNDLTWATPDGDPLTPGKEYEMHSDEYSVPDIIRVDEVKPNELVYTVMGEYSELEDRNTISRDEVERRGYKFLPAEGEAATEDSPEQSQNTEPTATSRVPITTTVQSDAADLHPVGTHVKTPNGNEYRVTGHHDGRLWAQRMIDGKPDGQAAPLAPSAVTPMIPTETKEAAWLLEGASIGVAPAPWQDPLEDLTGKAIERGEEPQTDRDWLVSDLPRTAGAKFSPGEQRGFIDEEGEARNLDRLDLENTHYRVKETSSKIPGKGYVAARPDMVDDDHLVFGL